MIAARRPTAVALLAAAATLVACGGSDTKPPAPKPTPEQQVTATWRAAATAAAAGNGAGFCPRVSPAGQAKLAAATQLPCEDAVRLLGSRLTPADRAAITGAQITGVTVTGDTAVVRYTSVPALARLGFTGRTTLERVGGVWLLRGT